MSHAASWKMEAFMKENQAAWFARRHEIEYIPQFLKGRRLHFELGLRQVNE